MWYKLTVFMNKVGTTKQYGMESMSGDVRSYDIHSKVVMYR